VPEIAGHADAGRWGPVDADPAGESAMQACAEAFVAESAGTVMAEVGLIPVLSLENRDAASLMRLQSIADPSQGLAGLGSPCPVVCPDAVGTRPRR